MSAGAEPDTSRWREGAMSRYETMYHLFIGGGDEKRQVGDGIVIVGDSLLKAEKTWKTSSKEK